MKTMKLTRPVWLIAALAAAMGMAGCRSTGTSLVVGEQTLLPKISDASDNMSIELYEDVKGAHVWARENSRVKAQYKCATTNDYLGVWHTKSCMELDVQVEPCADEAESEEK